MNNFKKESSSISQFTEKLGEVLIEAIEEDDNYSYEMAKGVHTVLINCKTEEEFSVANNMLIAICGYSIETLMERIHDYDKSGYIWETC